MDDGLHSPVESSFLFMALHVNAFRIVMSKSFLLSRTVWLNAVALGLALANHYIGSTGPIPVMDPQVVAMVIAVLNIGLRLVSKTPVTLTLPIAV
jgi:hypothetical protein